jgi:hypothetical protein
MAESDRVPKRRRLEQDAVSGKGDEPAAGTGSEPSLPAETASNAKEVIDLTDAPSPPPSAPSPPPIKPLCIGSIDTEALILFPSALTERGVNTEGLVRTRQVMVDAAGEEWLHVKCKWRRRGGPEGGMENDSIVVLNSE